MSFENLEERRLLSAADWVRQRFADLGAAVKTGSFTGRQNVNTPILFDQATVTGGEYGIDVSAPAGRGEFGVVDSMIKGQQDTDQDPYAASIIASNESSATVGYLVNVMLDPDFPPWDPVGKYDKTNYDGVTYDAGGPGSALYTSGVTVLNWADASLDVKSEESQHVGLTVKEPPDGPGHRALRFWKPGPHYLVDSTIEGSPTLIWVSDAAGDDFELCVWNSTFAGELTVPNGRAVFDKRAGTPRITYLDHDPRTRGEMHEMFAADNADFNSNSTVDAADYVVWRDNLGLTGSASQAQGDANGDMNVNDADYDVWRAHFGTMPGGSAGSGTNSDSSIAPAASATNIVENDDAVAAAHDAVFRDIASDPTTLAPLRPSRGSIFAHNSDLRPRFSGWNHLVTLAALKRTRIDRYSTSGGDALATSAGSSSGINDRAPDDSLLEAHGLRSRNLTCLSPSCLYCL